MAEYLNPVLSFLIELNTGQLVHIISVQTDISAYRPVTYHKNWTAHVLNQIYWVVIGLLHHIYLRLFHKSMCKT
jgi:hypothetical protein